MALNIPGVQGRGAKPDFSALMLLQSFMKTTDLMGFLFFM